jgi:hypothetical protein
MARVKDALQQLNFCRQVFGQGPTDEIIDGALSETEQGTRLVPAMKASDE